MRAGIDLCRLMDKSFQTLTKVLSASPDIASGDACLRGRFAPSPTGRMHAGNIFSALVSWVICKRSGGGVVLRIEDLDRSRSKAEYIDQIMRDFEFLGLTWDYGPYYQSSRDSVYEEAFNRLQEMGLVYPCYCTRADLHAASAPHPGEKPIYPGTCRMLASGDLQEKARAAAQAGRKPSLRIRVPGDCHSFCDGFQGQYMQVLDRDCGDFIVRRSDGAFAYQLAVVIDDAAQGVNCIVRGSDLLSSTPQQLFLQDILGLPHPVYAHVPLLMGPDGHRLSKRHKDADLECLLQRFGTSQAILGHIAFVTGLVPEDEPLTADQILRYADLSSLSGVDALSWS
ncbi:MAG: tRNA glutamyl-Q(34) synthetase GluQRS [Eggerthellaceae bacterium]